MKKIYIFLFIILLISLSFLISQNPGKVTGFATKVLNLEPATKIKILSDEQGNTIKTPNKEIFLRVVADKNNCVYRKFTLYRETEKLKDIKFTEKDICESTTIKYEPNLPYGDYTLKAIDINSEKELSTDFII